MACIDLHQTGFVDKSSDHLQLIKFWPSCAPGKGICSGVKIFGSTLLQPVCSVCVSLSAFFSFDAVFTGYLIGTPFDLSKVSAFTIRSHLGTKLNLE